MHQQACKFCTTLSSGIVAHRTLSARYFVSMFWEGPEQSWEVKACFFQYLKNFLVEAFQPFQGQATYNITGSVGEKSILSSSFRFCRRKKQPVVFFRLENKAACRLLSGPVREKIILSFSFRFSWRKKASKKPPVVFLKLQSMEMSRGGLQ